MIHSLPLIQPFGLPVYVARVPSALFIEWKWEPHIAQRARDKREQSAMLAAVLPNPKGWDSAKPGAMLRWRQQGVLQRERTADFRRN